MTDSNPAGNCTTGWTPDSVMGVTATPDRINYWMQEAGIFRSLHRQGGPQVGVGWFLPGVGAHSGRRQQRHRFARTAPALRRPTSLSEERDESQVVDTPSGP